MSHAPEPWSATDNSWEISTIYDANSQHICEVEIDSEATEDTQEEFELMKDANARRIVACVNACKGIQTEFLELGESEFVKALSERNKIKQQRDNLLAAMESLADLADGFSVSGVYFNEDRQNKAAIQRCFAAIDSVKGGAA